MSKQKKDNLGRELSKINIVSNFGFTIISNIIVGIILGLFFDNIFGTEKIFLIIFTFLGTAAGIYNGIKYILKEVEKYEREEKKK
ncbi:MAG: AtpZ/AtpI family protein [Fervidobacterium sp.]